MGAQSTSSLSADQRQALASGGFAAVGIFSGLQTRAYGKYYKRAGRNIARIWAKTEGQKVHFRALKDKRQKLADFARDKQSKIANMQYKHNKEEIQRALNINLRGVVKAYIDQTNGLQSEIENVKSQLNMAFDKKNVESQSIQDDTRARLKQESIEKSQDIQNQQNFMLDETINQHENMNYKTDIDYNYKNNAIEMNFIQAFSNAENQMWQELGHIDSVMKAGMNAGRNLEQQGRQMMSQGNQQIAQSIIQGVEASMEFMK